MLRGIRTATSNWFGKIVMGVIVAFLVVSFAIWGIGDVFQGSGTSTVAEVGETEISVDQFRQLYNDRLQQIARQVGRPITPSQARAAGIENQILGTLISEAVLDEHARQLGLGISQAEVARQIRREPAFHGPNGQFDQQRFLYLIRQAGFSEQRFLADHRRSALRRQLASVIGGEIKPPQAAADMVNRYQNEQRTIEYVALNASNAGEIPPPTPEQLKNYYETHKVAFRAPEYRKLMLLTLSTESVAPTIEVSAEDAKRAYEARQDRYVTPEKRQVQQIVYPNPEDAAKAHQALTAGTSFEALAAKRDIAETDLDIGLVAKEDILDPAIAEAAFALKEGEVSGPVNGRFGTVLVRVTKIEPGHTTPFAEVEKEVKQGLARDRARNVVSDRRDQVEDELAAGLRVEEIGKKLDIPVRMIEAVDRSGRGADGEPVPNLPKPAELIADAFATQVGVENDPLQLSDGGFVWYELDDIMPSRERSFDEVKDRVEARWREQEIANRLDAKATELVDKLKGGGWFGELAATSGLKLETAMGLTRRGADKLPSPVIAAVFRTPKDGAASAAGTTPTQRFVFRVTGITVPTFDAQSEQAKQLLDTLRSAYSEDIVGQYVAQLEADIGVSINQAALNQAIGRSADRLP